MDPVQSVPTPTPVIPPKKDYTLVVILSLTTLLGVLIAFFFYFQNQQLRKLITVVPSSTPLPSPTATADPTANWKTYTNTFYNFTFKYPDGLASSVEHHGYGKDSLGINNASIIFQMTDVSDAAYSPKVVYIGDVSINGNVFRKYSGVVTAANIEVDRNVTDYEIDTHKNMYILFRGNFSLNSQTPDEKVMAALLDQILSTFKFTEAQSTPSASPL